MTELRKTARCAIYTRKSTDHNLDLEFNSLDAQREACEAYIKSQAHAISRNRGVATEDCEKCKIIMMFKKGDMISFSPGHMRDVFLALLGFRNHVDAERRPKIVISLDAVGDAG